jgi:dihydrofolate synthase/folylpolyglutamate synthase
LQVAARFATLDAWLAWQERLHPATIDMGLERVRRVYEAMQLKPFTCPVVTVGGTNGKGSCVALLESILSAQGLKVGSFTSPHLIRYNERVHVGGREVSDAELIGAFERITDARGAVSLTFFEYNTLAALAVFAAAALDAIILEVGLGGRLDAVNLIDSDVALIVSVGLDHMEWLGATREAIGREKAGILRAGRPAVFGSADMPDSVRAVARAIGAQVIEPLRDFRWSRTGERWSWQGRSQSYPDLPPPALAGLRQFDNAAAVLAVLEALEPRLHIGPQAIARGLESVELPGRFQSVDRAGVTWIVDVAHNAAAAATLALNLAQAPSSGRTVAVFGALKDKDVAAVARAVAGQIDEWFLATIPGERGLEAGELKRRAFGNGEARVTLAGMTPAAFEDVAHRVRRGDRVVVFGSFHMAGPALEWLRLYSRPLRGLR